VRVCVHVTEHANMRTCTRQYTTVQVCIHIRTVGIRIHMRVVAVVVVVVVTAPRVSEAISGDHGLPPCLAYLKAGQSQRAI
jgi:hypothetical protein